MKVYDMADKLIFEVYIEIDNQAVSFLKGPAGEAVMIPFLPER